MQFCPACVDIVKVCSNCAYSREQQPYYREPEEWDAPGTAPDPRQFFSHYCTKMSSANGRPNDANTMAYACDAEQYGSRVYVKASFGCTMFSYLQAV